MAMFCGGINLNTDTFKIINGIICDIDATTVDKTKAVSQCGQLWDGALFKTATVNGRKIITLHGSDGGDVGTPIFIKGNCGVGLDGRFFHVANGVVSLQDGFILTVIVTPEDAAIKVLDVDSEEVAPITGTTNTFLLKGIGDSYSVMVEKDGYTGKTQTIVNDEDQQITVTLDVAP